MAASTNAAVFDSRATERDWHCVVAVVEMKRIY
jgi:hypothetical protein